MGEVIHRNCRICSFSTRSNSSSGVPLSEYVILLYPFKLSGGFILILFWKEMVYFKVNYLKMFDSMILLFIIILIILIRYIHFHRLFKVHFVLLRQFFKHRSQIIIKIINALFYLSLPFKIVLTKNSLDLKIWI